MEKINTLSSLDGRILLSDIYHELRYTKQLANPMVLFICWKICVHDKEINKYINKDVTLVHTLGFIRGTMLWIEEIVNRYYFSSVNSFVYFGAAILLTLIGIRRFSQNVSDTMVIGGIAFEALMLIIMFVVMMFTPSDDLLDGKKQDEQNPEAVSTNELLLEIGEIGSDLANAVNQLEKLNNNYTELITFQNELLVSIKSISESTANAVAPNPDMLVTMKETNFALSQLKSTVNELNQSTESLKKDLIETAVRKEIEKVFINKFTNEK